MPTYVDEYWDIAVGTNGLVNKRFETYTEPRWRHAVWKSLCWLSLRKWFFKTLDKIDPFFEWLHGRKCDNNCGRALWTTKATKPFNGIMPDKDDPAWEPSCTRMPLDPAFDCWLFDFHKRGRTVI